MPGTRAFFFFLEQAMLAGTILADLKPEQVCLLEQRLDYLLHAHHLLPDGIRASRLDQTEILHYHASFRNLYWMDDFEISRPLATWLRSRLPFRPALKMNRKRVTAVWFASWFVSQLPLRRAQRRVMGRLPRLSSTIP